LKPRSLALSPFFNKPVRDEHGYTIGKAILASSKDENNSSKYVLIESENSEFIFYPLKLLRQDGDGLILIPSLNHRAEEIIKNIPLIWRKKQILEEISAMKRLPVEELVEIEKGFRTEFNDLKSEAQIVSKEIEAQIKIYAHLLKELNSASIYLEVEQELNAVERIPFNTVKESLQNKIEHIELKKRNLEDLLRRITNATLGEIECSKSGTPSKENDLQGQGEKELIVHIEDLSRKKF